MMQLIIVISAFICVSSNGVCTACEPQLRTAGGLGSLQDTYRHLAIKRTENINHLHDYANTGTFPRNTDFPGQKVPYFVDALGTACAVGHLMRLDGEETLVARIASSTNHVRIVNVDDGPLLDWICDSGLTKGECALIQPSYATIEDYRRGRAWQDEIARLQKHFAEVEQTLTTQMQHGLREALIAKVEAQLTTKPNDPAFAIDALSKALRSDEPNVRIAAAYAMAQISEPSPSVKLSTLERNLSDPDLDVRFWTAVAMQAIGAASTSDQAAFYRRMGHGGNAELHSRTLPVFLDAAQSNENGLRLAAFTQLANTAPMTMGTNRQLRIMPEIRHIVVNACEDKDEHIREFARSVLRSWRWQRAAYESQRIPQHYLAESEDLESLATETLAIGRKFAEQPDSISSVIKQQSVYDTARRITYMLPVATETPLSIARSSVEAKRIVDDYFKRTYEQYRNQTESPWPFWKILSTETDKQDLCYIVAVRRTDHQQSPKLLYLLPRPSMLSKASSLPYYWFKREDSPNSIARGGTQRNLYHPNEDAEVVLSSLARNDVAAFTTTCDLFAYFLTHHSQLVINRTVEESPDEFVWTGRFAMLRKHSPRFFGEGVGSYKFGGGGWDFYRFGFRCDRATGQLTISTEPIDFAITQLPSSVLSPGWVTQEYKLMGWKPLQALDFFGDALFPPEYHEAIRVFNHVDTSKTRRILYRRHVVERFLPHPALVLGLLYEQSGERESAVRSMQQAAESNRHDPKTLADVARWELGVGIHDDAQKHAESALELCPDHPEAKLVLERLEQNSISRTKE